jgi:hypothetical protein
MTRFMFTLIIPGDGHHPDPTSQSVLQTITLAASAINQTPLAVNPSADRVFKADWAELRLYEFSKKDGANSAANVPQAGCAY